MATLGRPPSPETERRRKQVRTLREKGKTYAQIGAALGITRTGAWQLDTGYDGYRRRDKK